MKTYHNLLDTKLQKRDIDEFVVEKLYEIITSAKSNSIFYSRIKSLDINDFPVIDKSMMKSNIDQFINKRGRRYNRFKFNTGGSTGEPFEFFTNRQSGYIDASHQLFHHHLVGYQKGDKIFAIDGIKIPESIKKKNQYWMLSDYSNTPYGSLHYSALNMSSEILDLIIEDLNKRKPAILRGYPSAFSDIANYIVDNKLKLNFKLKGVILTAENISESQKILISKAFGAPVFGQYGHSEKCIYAFTEANSLKYKCSPYYGYVEILDDQCKHVQEGEIGRVVVTSYYNDMMFFLRYDTGDLAEYGGTDKKGYVILNRIVGRKQDFIYDRQKQRVNVTALIFGQHFKAFANITRWQIIQTDFGKIEVLIIRGTEYSYSDENEIVDKISALGFLVEIKYVSHIRLTPRGKHRLVDSRIPNF